MQTVVRQATIDDKNAIWDFISVAYGNEARDKIPDRWNWEFLENPLVDKSRKEIPVFIAIKDGNIIGQMGEMLCQIKIGEDMYRIGTGVDLIVHPDYRRYGIAKKLIEAISKHLDVRYTIVRSKITTKILDTYKQLGYQKFKTIPVYRRFVKLDRVSASHFLTVKTANHLWMKSIVKLSCRFGLDEIISAAVNFLIKTRDLLEHKKKETFRSEIKEVQQFGDEIDQLWNAISDKFKIIIKRDRQFLNWRFSNHTKLDYRKFISICDGETKGYIVIRNPDSTELNRGTIVDLFAAPDDNETIESLIHHAIDFFGKSVLMIECPASLREYQRALSKFGFLRIGKTEPYFCCKDSILRSKLEKWGNDWFITKADQDWDQLQPI